MNVSRPLSIIAFGVFLLTAAGTSPRAVAAQSRGIDVVLDSALLAGYEWRNIGPDRGGRSIAVSGVRGRPEEGYFGATGGWSLEDV